ncbi:type II toxin-antitoxin system PemK/MazF family toxin [Niveispirillum irakense]|uniref:type II toxin-antitoxin system PemK/MazF family toxin n=1 Tax=Niveispirillum irakense TaxID=34011 RepID=UPI0006855BF4|nr:type II toxin-antitoxin system PemK/MazF family toxin [Niveispirillum irakense]
MIDIPFGSIILTAFPFTDLSSTKRRPALALSRDQAGVPDIIVAYITSVPRIDPFAVPLFPDRENGLKVPSMVRFDKLATIDKSIISGRLGSVNQTWLQNQRALFYSVFGFEI